jgi:hypothetical protein
MYIFEFKNTWQSSQALFNRKNNAISNIVPILYKNSVYELQKYTKSPTIQLEVKKKKK